MRWAGSCGRPPSRSSRTTAARPRRTRSARYGPLRRGRQSRHSRCSSSFALHYGRKRLEERPLTSGGGIGGGPAELPSGMPAGQLSRAARGARSNLTGTAPGVAALAQPVAELLGWEPDRPRGAALRCSRSTTSARISVGPRRPPQEQALPDPRGAGRNPPSPARRGAELCPADPLRPRRAPPYVPLPPRALGTATATPSGLRGLARSRSEGAPPRRRRRLRRE